MLLSNFSIRTIMGLIVGMMGMFALVLALLSGEIHHNLVFQNQQSMMEEMIGIATKEQLRDLAETSQDLGLALQSTPVFKAALKTKDQTALVNLLNNQFNQYFVTAGVIKLEQLILLDKNFSLIAESTDGSVFFHKYPQSICPELIHRARQRTGFQRIKIVNDVCLYNQQPVFAVIVPMGGLKLKGYVMVLTDPTHNLIAVESSLGIPLNIQLNDKQNIYQSSKWPSKESDLHISGYKLNSASGLPILSIFAAQNISDLSQSLQEARLKVLLISGFGTLLIAALSIFIMRSTMMKPLEKLASKLRIFHSDQSRIGEILKVTGTRDIHDIIEGFNDMSHKLNNLYQSLEHMAYTDSLTKLPNRNQFHQSLVQSIQLHQQIKKPFTLFLIDLDRFKGVNDTLGHHVGDELLIAVSEKLQSVLRDDDIISRLDENTLSQLDDEMVARLGGDEFSAILTNVHTPEDSIVVARKLLRAMEKPFNVNEHQLTIGLSIGIAMYPEHGEDIHTLVSHADVAMYDAKNRNCGFSIYDSAQNKNSLFSLQLEQDLFASIRNNELVLYYQPKISTSDGSVVGAEALIRWQHPTHGLIPPDNFIPMAEQSGLIQPMTEWVLNQALSDCSKCLCAEKEISVSINLSALNLRDERISTTIADALHKWSVPPKLLTLELTESTIMSDPEFSISVLKKLDKMGVTLSIDDFGTGHSSLSYVKHLPIDEIKIDKSFVKDLTQDSDNEAIIRAVLVLAHHKNLSVVAEGIEDIETFNKLCELECDIAQGYYFAKPMPFEEYLLWLENNQFKDTVLAIHKH